MKKWSRDPACRIHHLRSCRNTKHAASANLQRKLQNLLLGLSRLAPGIFAKVASDLSAQMLAMQGDRVANAPQAGELTEISQDIAVIAQSSSGKS